MDDRHGKTDKFKIQAYDTITSLSTEKHSAQFSTWFYLCICIVIRVPLIADSTNHTEQSPSLEVSSSSDSQKMPRMLIPKVLRRVHNSPPRVPLLSQLNPVHALPTYFLMNHFNIILPYTPGIPSGLLPSDIPNKILQAPPLRHTCHLFRPSRFSWFGHWNNI